MSKPTYRKTFHEYLAAFPGFLDLPETEKEFYGAPDRVVVILQASFVDNILREILTTKMRPDLPGDMLDRIFEGNGPLSTFSSRINIGYAFGLYGRLFHHDLDIIRELRNGFAHSRHPMTLGTPEVAGMCKHLQTPDHDLRFSPHNYPAYFPEDAKDNTNPRTRFVVACHTIAVRLLQVQPEVYKTRVLIPLP